MYETDRIPVPERVSFTINTLLSDAASFIPKDRETISAAQVDFLQGLLKLMASCQVNGSVDAQDEDYLCRYLVPLFVGAARAIGRAPMCPKSREMQLNLSVSAPQETPKSVPLFSRLFPRPPPPPPYDSSNETTELVASPNNSRQNSLAKKQTLPNLQKLLPHSLSTNLNMSQLSSSATWTGSFMSNSRSTALDLNLLGNSSVTITGNNVGGTNRSSKNSAAFGDRVNKFDVDERKYFYCKLGSCFGSLNRIKMKQECMNMLDNVDKVSGNNVSGKRCSSRKMFHLNVDLIRTLLDISKKVFNNDLLNFLDDSLNSYMNRCNNVTFHYKSFREIVTLATITLLRESLEGMDDLPKEIITDVQDIVKVLFLTLSERTHSQGISHREHHQQIW